MKKENIAFVISIILLVGVVAVLMVFLLNLKSSVQTVLEPVVSINSSAATQVAYLLKPTPTIRPDPITIIHEIRSLARLETIEYSVEKVITAETGQGAFKDLFGEKLLFVAHGTVIAGIDLEKLQVSDAQLENGIIKIKLPPAEVFAASLDNQKSYIYDRQTGIFTKGDANLETEARKAAEIEINNAAMKDGIIAQAETNAEVFLTRFLFSLGYKNVEFVK